MITMNRKPEKSNRRRDFLKSGMRVLLLGVIACISGLLGWRKIRSSECGNYCVVESPCRRCSEFSGCTYSRAAESRRSDGNAEKNLAQRRRDAK